MSNSITHRFLVFFEKIQQRAREKPYRQARQHAPQRIYADEQTALCGRASRRCHDEHAAQRLSLIHI